LIELTEIPGASIRGAADVAAARAATLQRVRRHLSTNIGTAFDGQTAMLGKTQGARPTGSYVRWRLSAASSCEG